MKKIYSLLIVLLFVGSAFAQTEFKFTTEAIEIDGFAEEAWDAATAYPIDKPFKAEVPTVTATWQALYDAEFIYVLLTVDDDNHWPGWEAGGDNWLYDKPEVYFDVNEVLDDAVGAGTDASGHYQYADGFLETGYDTPFDVTPGTRNPGGTFCYSLVGEGYVYEHKFAISSLNDKETAPFVKTRVFGFDVTVIDQDEGITTARQRAVWGCDGNGNNGSTDEAWNNLDGAGECILEPVSSSTMKNRTMSVYPNPAIDNVTINADFNKVVISNVLGQQVKSIGAKSKTVNISDLSKGVYVIKAYKNDKYVGTAKVTKN